MPLPRMVHSVPSSIRLPPRFLKEKERARKRNAIPQVDSEVIQRAFAMWDSDDDGRVNAADLLRFVDKTRPYPPQGGWHANVEHMMAEATTRTGFCYPVSCSFGASDRASVILVRDVVAAVSVRTDPRTKKCITRPYRDMWITLIRAAKPGAEIFCAPHPSDRLFAPPAITYAERQHLAALADTMRPATARKIHTIAISPSTLLAPSLRSMHIFQCCNIAKRPYTAPELRPPRRKDPRRADGISHEVSPLFDPHHLLARKVSSAGLATDVDQANDSWASCTFHTQLELKQLKRHIDTWSKGGAKSDSAERGSKPSLAKEEAQTKKLPS